MTEDEPVEAIGDGAVEWLAWVRRDRLLWNLVVAFVYLQLLVVPPVVYSYLSNRRGWPQGAALSVGVATGMSLVLLFGAM